MKKEKIILSAAAIIATAGGILAFKVHGKFGVGHNLYAITSFGGCIQVTCRTSPTGSSTAGCHTVNGTTISAPFFKARKNDGTCTKPTLKWTGELADRI